MLAKGLGFKIILQVLFILCFEANENILTCTASTSVWGYFLKERKEIEKEIDFCEMDHWGIQHRFGGDEKSLVFS